MAKVFEGKLDGSGLKIGIVVSRFNELVTGKLLEGALDCLRRHGTTDDDIGIAWTPGAFELPLVAQKLAQAKQYDAVICLGAVIRGQTPHFDFVAGEAAKGIGQVMLQSGLPIIFGVVTTDTFEQAVERAGVRQGNRGWDAALAAIEMANLAKAIS